MKKAHAKYEFLYQAIVSQMDIGNLKYGDSMPTIEELCLKYDLGITTVRKAYELLKKNNYISSASGRRARVIYQTGESKTATDPNKEYLTNVLRKKNAIMQSFKMAGIIMPHLLKECAFHCGEIDLHYLKSLTAPNERNGLRLETVSRISKLYLDSLLGLLRNPITDDLHFDLMLFFQLPVMELNIPFTSCHSPETILDLFRRITALIERKEFAGIPAVARQFYSYGLDEFQQYYQLLPEPPRRLKRTTFQWQANKGKLHLYTELALTLMREIDTGVYPDATILPTIVQLAKTYQVSEITTRNALKILKDLNLVRTVSSVGTKVTLTYACRQSLRLDHPFVQQGIYTFTCALQLLCLISQEVIVSSVRSIPYPEIQRVQRRFDQQSAGRPGELFADFYLDALIRLLPQGPLRVVFEQLSLLLSWGYFLRFCRHLPERIEMSRSSNLAVLQSVRSGNPRQFGKQLTRHFRLLYTWAMETTSAAGMEDIPTELSEALPESFSVT